MPSASAPCRPRVEDAPRAPGRPAVRRRDPRLRPRRRAQQRQRQRHVLVDPGGQRAGPAGLPRRRVALHRRRRRAGLDPRGRRGRRRRPRLGQGPDGRGVARRPDRLRGRGRQPRELRGHRERLGRARGLGPPRHPPIVASVRVPVLYLGSREDPFTEGTKQPRALQRALRSRSAKFELVEGSEHGIVLLESGAGASRCG